MIFIQCHWSEIVPVESN